MKSVFLLVAAMAAVFITSAQGDKSKLPSPPASATETLANGTVVTINYSQPSVKGRTIGTDLEPKNGIVWRTGANKATVFEISNAAKVGGKELAAGKYGLFTIAGDDEWTIIFNKTWDQWGAFNYKEADDALRIKVKPWKTETFSEKMTFTIGKDGTVTLLWGNIKVEFKVG